MGSSPRPTLPTRNVLPIRLSTRILDGAMGSRCNCLYLSTIYGKSPLPTFGLSGKKLFDRENEMMLISDKLQNGGLLCGMDGEVSVPFPEKPFCYEGHGTF